MRCPCRKKSETTTYAECCELYHLGTVMPPTPQVLMRSRYAAFALQLVLTAMPVGRIVSIFGKFTNNISFTYLPGSLNQ